MSQLIARLLLAMMLVPTSVAFFLLLVLALVAMRGQPGWFHVFAVWIPVSAFVICYWLWIWKPVVRWSKSRIMLTVAAWVLAAAVSAGFGVMLGRFMREVFPPACAAGALTQLLWVLATIVIWRETNAERAERVRSVGAATVACPACGYNLTGLRETRCPECGASFPLEDLIAAQRDRLGSIEQ